MKVTMRGHARQLCAPILFFLLLQLYKFRILAQNGSDTSESNGPKLPFGDINVLVLTDVHSWIGGHKFKEPDLDADYGHVLSFYEHLKAHCESKGLDLWFVVNGDWNDGTGLTLNGDPSYIEPLLQKMPWDAVNTGNHELYQNPVIQYFTRPGGFTEWWGKRFLTSNIVHSINSEPLGYRYNVLKGKQANVLTFGFLYDMYDNANLVTVKKVESTVNEDWFVKAVKEESYDAIMVLAHMGHDDELLRVILNKIRSLVGTNMPVQFITGHTHVREYVVLDDTSTSFEAGRFLDTVGFVSFPSKSSLESTQENRTSLFKHEFIDANIQEMRDILGIDVIQTENGKELSDFIYRTQEELGLHEEVGCLQDSYFMNRSLHESDSLWRFFANEVVPNQFEEHDALLVDQGMFRYDLLGGGQMRVDDIIAVCPFNETFHAWKGLPGEVIVAINKTLNVEVRGFFDVLPEFILASAKPFNNASNYTLWTSAYDTPMIQKEINTLFPGSDFSPPVEISQTMLDVWLDYFLEHRPCGRSWGGHGSTSSNKRPSTPFGAGVQVTDEQADRLRLGFAVAAVLAVVILGAINVRQRGILWQRETDQREFATLEAIREREDEEGEFV